MSAEQVISKLEEFNGSQFKYATNRNSGFFNWALSSEDKPQPDFTTCALCCFHLPLAAAIEVDCIDRIRAGDMIENQIASVETNKSPNLWSPSPLISRSGFWELWGLWDNKLPNRGDIVFFSAKNIPYFAHVAVATGNEDELISFGHDAPYLDTEPPPALLVRRISIREVLNINLGLTSVHFGSPSW